MTLRLKSRQKLEPSDANQTVLQETIADATSILKQSELISWAMRGQ